MAASKITDDNGDISKEDFIKISQDYKLLDFGNIMTGGDIKSSGSKRQNRSNTNNNNMVHLQGGKVGETTFPGTFFLKTCSIIVRGNVVLEHSDNANLFHASKLLLESCLN